MEGGVITVSGRVEPETLGIALTHEHVFADARKYFTRDPDERIAAALDGPLTLENVGLVRRSLVNSLDDLLVDDDALAVRELRRFAERGGRTVCCLSAHGLRVPDHAERLRAVARETGLNIVMGTGAYIRRFHPAWIAGESEDQLTERFVAELVEGVDGTGVRAGLIGEIGLGHPEVHEDEWKVLRAAGRAQLETGAPIVIHQTDRAGVTPHRALDELAMLGVAPQRVVIGHAATCGPLEPLVAAAQRGAYVAFDTVGISADIGTWDMPGENWYAQRVAELCERGHAERVLLSQDVAHKRALHAYGGPGYDHVLATLVPKLRAVGLDEATVQTLLVDNAARLLTIGR